MIQKSFDWDINDWFDTDEFLVTFIDDSKQIKKDIKYVLKRSIKGKTYVIQGNTYIYGGFEAHPNISICSCPGKACVINQEIIINIKMRIDQRRQPMW